MEITLNEAINSLFSMLETAIYNYEIDVMVEAEGTSDAPEEAETKKAFKFKTFIETAKRVLFRIWDVICKAFDSILLKLSKWRGPVVIEKDLNVYPATLKFDSKLVMYAGKLLEPQNISPADVDEIKKYINTLDKTAVLKKGTRVMNKSFEGPGKKYRAAADKLKQLIKKMDEGYKPGGENTTEILSETKTIMNRVSGILTSVIEDINKINSWHEKQYAEETEEMIAKKREKREAKANDKFAKENVKDNDEAIKERPTNESIDYSDLTDKILSESVRLLSECDDFVTDDSFQKSIDDITEEVPAKDDEYPADDVTGGEGNIDDSDIKELLDGDNEAYKIATENDGSAITESVIIKF